MKKGKEGKTEKRYGKMEAGKGKSMKRRETVREEKTERKNNWKVKSIQTREQGVRKEICLKDSVGFHVFP